MCRRSHLPLRAALSPTNLGFLLNARQVACEFGYLTIPEFAEQTIRTLATIANLQRYRGHLLNWYDTRSLDAIDSRNLSPLLITEIWWLHSGPCEQGCLDLLRQSAFADQRIRRSAGSSSHHG